MLLAQLVRHSSFISSRRLGASVSVLCGVRKAAAAGMAGMASATNELQKEHLTEQKTVTALVVPKKQCATTMKLFKGCVPYHQGMHWKLSSEKTLRHTSNVRLLQAHIQDATNEVPGGKSWR